MDGIKTQLFQSFRMSSSVCKVQGHTGWQRFNDIEQPDCSYVQSPQSAYSNKGGEMWGRRRFTGSDLDELLDIESTGLRSNSTPSSFEVAESVRRQKRKEQNRAAYVILPTSL